MAKPNRMKYNRQLGMWEGRFPDGRTVYVSDGLWTREYARNLRQSPKGRHTDLTAMTTPEYWLPTAETYQAELGSNNSEAFVEG